MTMVSLPNILFSIQEEASEDMSDIQFLSIKEFDGKLRSDEGSLGSGISGDLATLTANVGKDMYLGRAQITLRHFQSVSSTSNPKVELSINGVVIEITEVALSNDFKTIVYEFKNVGRRVLAGQIIKLESIHADVDLTIKGFIECWEEDTGESPQIPPLKSV